MAITNVLDFELSLEQKEFIEKALNGNNILVDACIGSGKTTAIQQLCNDFSDDKKILYLTYNRLLKIDAQNKIKSKNTFVTNYHGFAKTVLQKENINCGVSDLISTFNRNKPSIEKYDILIIDEYQDIEKELADMLMHIKKENNGIQIIAVGDMMQKIYDRSTLNISSFIRDFLEKYICLSFTKCFRLPSVFANKLGKAWKKKIEGVNDQCIVEKMSIEDAKIFLVNQQPQDLLCLGQRIGTLSDTLNYLEQNYPEKFNKKTVFASIRDDDGNSLKPNKNVAIFTTFDSSKGMERPICIVFDFTEKYWNSRIKNSQISQEILRNIFCVAASRGKRHIIFVDSGEKILQIDSFDFKREEEFSFKDVDMSEMFQFKYNEDVETCYSLLETKNIELSKDNELIDIKNNDELIDLSPCIGIYQEAVFFGERSLNSQIENYFVINPSEIRKKDDYYKINSLDEKILFLTALKTGQNRYVSQVEIPFVSNENKEKIMHRLSEQFIESDNVQVPCKIDFASKDRNTKLFSAIGLADVVKNNTVYELKFVSELTHEHFLQCACYMIALNIEKGILWNTRNNEAFQITIPNKKAFLDNVTKTISKELISEYYEFNSYNSNKENIIVAKDCFVVIDTETNFDDEVMSIGIVLANANTFKPIKSVYYILEKEAKTCGWFSYALNIVNRKDTKYCTRETAINEIINLLQQNNNPRIFAYNYTFDKRHLPELDSYTWCDIIWLSAYKAFNNTIPEDAELTKLGKLKRDYGVEPTLCRLRGTKEYEETHNALYDALDELEIMQRLNKPIDQYILPKNNPKLTAYNNSSKKFNDLVNDKIKKESSSIQNVDKNNKIDEPILINELSIKIKQFSEKYLSDNSNMMNCSKCYLDSYKDIHEAYKKGKSILKNVKKLNNIPSFKNAVEAAKAYRKSEFDRLLSKISVDEMSKIKKGIRISTLKYAGYTNMFDLQDMNYPQLISIDGIGPTNAENILYAKSIINEMTYSKIVLKPSVLRTIYGEEAIKEYCLYRWNVKIHKEITNILDREIKILEEYLKKSSISKNILCWIFTFSKKRKSNATEAATSLKNRVDNITQNIVNDAESLFFNCIKAALSDSWKDYIRSKELYESWIKVNSK